MLKITYLTQTVNKDGSGWRWASQYKIYSRNPKRTNRQATYMPTKPAATKKTVTLPARLAPLLRLEIPLEIVPTNNSKNRTNRSGIYKGAGQTKKIINDMRDEVIAQLKGKGFTTREVKNYMRLGEREGKTIERLVTTLVAYPALKIRPWNTTRDLDGNDLKDLFDAFTEANIWSDDKSLQKLNLEKTNLKDKKGRRLEVLFYELGAPLALTDDYL